MEHNCFTPSLKTESPIPTLTEPPHNPIISTPDNANLEAPYVPTLIYSISAVEVFILHRVLFLREKG